MALRVDQLVRVPVPFLDLRPIHEPLGATLVGAIAELIESGRFINGPEVQAFEEAFASYCGTRECVGLASGLDALRLALVAAGIQAGDEVVVPANTFVATFESIVQAGGVPVPVDVCDSDYNIDPSAVAARIGERTAAIVPVHLYGQLADMGAIVHLASKSGLIVVEDACQAHGATRDGNRAGSTGAAAAFSFYPGKNLGAFGDAGALVTSDPTLAERVRMLREHGQREKYRHELVGYTARLDTLQAIVLLRKLALLDEWNEQRTAVALRYSEGLAGIDELVLPPVAAGSSPVWHLYVIRTARRDGLASFLRERAIGFGVHYPEPAHLSAAFASLGYRRGDFPVAEALADQVLSLPIFPGMTDLQVNVVVDATRAFFGDG